LDTSEYCREIEAYLCRKNDGHLIRVVGPSFDIVAGWATAGVPLKIAYRGIDRCFERYYRKGPRRRPVRIDFCEADVLDAFDEWRRAIGMSSPSDIDGPGNGPGRPEGKPSSRQGAREEGRSSAASVRAHSLPMHLKRALLRLTDARARGVLGPSADAFLDRVSRELDVASAQGRRLRGDARRDLVTRLAELDAELLGIARESVDASIQLRLEEEVDEELLPFRERMAPDAYASAREAGIDRLVRERFGLPVLKMP
jgi:hypothetical protein